MTSRGSHSRSLPASSPMELRDGQQPRKGRAVASQPLLSCFAQPKKGVHTVWVNRLVEKVVKPPGLTEREFVRRRDMAIENVRYVAYAAYLAFPDGLFSACRSARVARAGFRALVTDASRTFINRGPLAGLRWLKDLSADARRRGLGDQSASAGPLGPDVRKYLRGRWSLQGLTEARRIEALLQFATFGRSLPEPPAEVVKLALRKHARTLTSPFVCESELVRSFRSFVFGWAQAHLDTEVGVSSALSTSASFETTRSAGGALSSIRAITEEYRAREVSSEANDPWFPVTGGPPRWQETGRKNVRMRSSGTCAREYCEYTYDKNWCETNSVDLDQWEVLREHLFCRDACLEAATPILLGQRLPSCRQSVVATRGGKARVVTSIEAPFVYLCHFWRKAIYPGLRRWGATADVLRADHYVALEEWLRSLPDDLTDEALVRSVDMSEATDRLPLDLMGAAIEALTDHFGLDRNGWEYLCGRASVGSYNMKLHNGKSVKTCRGILMGLPTSWSLLCLYNGWLWLRSGGSPCYPISARFGLTPIDLCEICGDDLLGVSSELESYRYSLELNRTGGQISEGRDFLSRDRGLFTEVAVDVRARKLIPVVSVKGLTASGDADNPSWLVAGPAASAALQTVARGRLRRRAILFARWFHRETRGWMRQVGLLPDVPRCLGGGGFPTDSEAAAIRRAPKSYQLSVRVLMSGQSDDVHAFKSLFGLSDVWKSNALAGSAAYFSEINEVVWASFEAKLKEGLRVFDSGVTTLPPERVLRLCDFFGEKTSVVSAYLLCRGPCENQKSSRETLRKTARRFRLWVEEVNRLCPQKWRAQKCRDLWKGFSRFKARLDRLAIAVSGVREGSLTVFGAPPGRRPRPYESGHEIAALGERARKRRRPTGLAF